MMNYFYITTPIYYVNSRPHLGHVYTSVIADVLARFNRISGKNVFFLTGTDEHGDKIAQTAKKQGRPPRELVDENSALFRAILPEMSVENDRFIRTSEPDHVKVVQSILQKVYDSGDIYFGEYGGNYCLGCERFLTDSELENGKCPQHQTEPTHIKEKNYFFKMEKYRHWLIDHINANPDFIRPQRYRNEVLGMLREPLDDLCISRPKQRLSWGIDLPFDNDYVCYVWFDALINYLTGIGYPDGAHFNDYWGASQHLIAKDILKPHGVYWPTMLKAAGIEPYKNLNVHGYWNIDMAKMSKSLGNVVNPLDLKEKYGLDAFRYYLVRDMVFGLDSNFSEDAMIDRYNADLANDLGNLVNRSLGMLKKYYGGVIPETGEPENEEDIQMRDLALSAAVHYRSRMKSVEMQNALAATWSLVSGLNKYIDKSAPWTLVKTDQKRLAAVMYNIMEGIRFIAVMTYPVMPDASRKILAMIGTEDNFDIDSLNVFGFMKGGVKTQEPRVLFPRVEKLEALEAGSELVKAAEIKEDKKEEKKEALNLIDISEFARAEIRVGRILSAERVPKSDKLIIMKVDIGEERQVVAGIGKAYTPEELTGKKIAVVTNLKPAKLMGIESFGMLLATDTEEGGLSLIGFDRDVKVGSRIR
jgi:methionyl-tRNA synthetase